MCPLAPGIIETVAKDFFDTEVTMDILDLNEEVERTGKKEHAVFLITQKSHRQMRSANPIRLQDCEDIQRDHKVLSLLCLQKTQFPKAELIGLGKQYNHSGVEAGFLNF